MFYKHEKRYSIALVMEETLIKIGYKILQLLYWQANILKTPVFGKNVEYWELLYIAGGSVHWQNHFGKRFVIIP